MNWIAFLAWLLVAGVAVLHLVFMAKEMSQWTTIAPKLAGLDTNVAVATIPLGKNQGLYNGFLAFGLIWSLCRPWILNAQGTKLREWPFDWEWACFFLLCVLIAGVFATFTLKPDNRFFLKFQALPALFALIAVAAAQMNRPT